MKEMRKVEDEKLRKVFLEYEKKEQRFLDAYTIKSKVKYTLKEIFNDLSDEEIQEFAESKFQEFTKRDETIEMIFDEIIYDGYFENLFTILNKEDHKTLKKFYDFKSKEEALMYIRANRVLLDHRVVFIYYDENKYHLVVPKEIQEHFALLNTRVNIIKRDYFEKIHNGLTACANFYGIISLEEAKEILKTKLNLEFNDDEYYEYVTMKNMLYNSFCEDQEYIVINTGNDPEEFIYVMKEIMTTQPRYIPTKNELLNYVDLEYYRPTDETKALKEYISLFEDDFGPSLALKIMSSINYYYLDENYSKSIFKYEEKLTETHKKRILKLMDDVLLTTPLWKNKCNVVLKKGNHYKG